MQAEVGRKKKLGLALSGCGSRAVMYFAMLEVFDEHGIKIDMISSCSSSTFVACAYSCGNLKGLKDLYFSLNRKELFDLFTPTFKGGIFSFDKATEVLRKHITVDNLEDLPIPVSIVASDITHGSTVTFNIGNIDRAIKASCCMPGLFEPVVWNGRTLVDGGLFQIVPAAAVKDMGADIVIAVDLAATRNLFTNGALHLRRGYNMITMPLKLLNILKTKVASALELTAEPGHVVTISDEPATPSIFAVVAKSMDYAMDERAKGEHFICDLILKPSVDGFKDIDMGNREAMYAEGRRAALEALPAIKKLLEE